MPLRLCTHLSALIAVTGGILLLAPGTDSALASGRCDELARRGENPRRFVRSLDRGDTGCFRAGRTYWSTRRPIVATTPGVTITTTPRGRRARIIGRLWLTRRADDTTVRRLILDGRNRRRLPSPTVNASKALFARNVVTNRHTGICFILGSRGYGRARDAVIRQNRIHDCGRLPATNRDHGIYVAEARGTVIRDNWIYDNADRGIQLYPDADGSTITGNVIDGNGQGIIFGSGRSDSPDNNLVEGNVITNSRIRYNVESHSQGAPYGQGNVVQRNCVHGGARDDGDGGIQSPQRGFVARRNLFTEPRYVSRQGHDYRLGAKSLCRWVIGRNLTGLRR